MRMWVVVLLLSIQLAIHAKEPPLHERVEDQSELTIDTPGLAGRQVRKLRLNNGLEALLISDPTTPESGASLSVGVGTWDDPKDRPGMAHFVEHLLFLGTKKYPEEEGYSRYLDEHGGKRNAYTMADRTVYMFSVNNNGFLEALDRFGQFFIAPLFSPSGVDRECKAIHQEFCKNVPLDLWRVHYVKKELANTAHPFHCFCIGNRDTLACISQDELKEWYRNHYSAHLMRLVVYSPCDLDTLEKEVFSIFSQVKSAEHMHASCPEPIYYPSQAAALAAIAPLQDIQLLELSWELPRHYGQDRDLHIDKLVSHVLGHEGSTSLLSQLKRENLAEGLGVGATRAGKDQCLLALSVQLTSKGVQNYERVIQRCFEAIASIKQSGIPLFVFDEVRQIQELNYRFQPRGDIFKLVSEYASSLLDEPIETFPRKTLIPTRYSPEQVGELLHCLKPESCRYTLVANPGLTNFKPDRKERWMGVDYTVLPIAKEKIAAWSSVKPHPAIAIPRPNPFLPKNLTVKDKAATPASFPEPRLICDSPAGKVYACADERFLVPEIAWSFYFKTPSISDADPKSHALADLFCHTVKERLNASSYEASLAGLSYTLETKHNGIELKLKGFSDKAPDFLVTILNALKTVKPTKEEFNLFCEQLARDYQNTANVSPVKQGGELLWGILYKDYAGLNEKCKALKNISFTQASVFCSLVLKESFVEGMLYGNQSNEEAQQVWQNVRTILNSKPYPLSQHCPLQLASLPDEGAALLTTSSSHPANALILTADCGHFSFKRAAALEILVKGLEEPFFSELRTRQQTAYVVGNWSQEIERHLYAFFAIQSSSHDTRDLLSRFELFLETSLQKMADEVLPRERFESIRNALVYKLKHPAEQMSKMGALLYTLATDYDGDFKWLEKRIHALNELTYEEVLSFANAWFGKDNSKRMAICVNGTIPTKGRVTYRNIQTPEKIREEISYRGKDLSVSIAGS